MTEHEQEAASRRRDGGSGGDGGEGGEAVADAAMNEVERDGTSARKNKKQQSTTGVEKLVKFPPLCRPLQ